MRKNFKLPPEHNDVRNKSKFLLFPKTINYEMRWLEVATYSQTYTHPKYARRGAYGWKDECWLD